MPDTTIALPGLLIALALAPVCVAAILVILKWMFDNQLDVGPGLAAIFGVMVIALVTVMSKSNFVAGAVLAVMITLMVFLPYAVEQVTAAELRGIDIDKLDRVHQELVQRPENVASYFAMADLVYELGLHGHAIAISERTLERLSTMVDPIKNQSMRDVFRAEESRAREWRRRVTDPAAFRPVACPRCGQRNEPGTIACAKCQGPFLLDLARRIDPRPKIRSRLVFGWALVACFFTGTVYSWSVFEGNMRLVTLGVGLALVAGVFTWLFRPRVLQTV